LATELFEKVPETPGAAPFIYETYFTRTSGTGRFACKLHTASDSSPSGNRVLSRGTLRLYEAGNSSQGYKEMMASAGTMLYRLLSYKSYSSKYPGAKYKARTIKANLQAEAGFALTSLGRCLKEATSGTISHPEDLTVYVGADHFSSRNRRPVVGWATWQIVSAGEVISSGLEEDTKMRRELSRINVAHQQLATSSPPHTSSGASPTCALDLSSEPRLITNPAMLPGWVYRQDGNFVHQTPPLTQ
jgi:hypothetical protein